MALNSIGLVTPHSFQCLLLSRIEKQTVLSAVQLIKTMQKAADTRHGPGHKVGAKAQ